MARCFLSVCQRALQVLKLLFLLSLLRINSVDLLLSQIHDSISCWSVVIECIQMLPEEKHEMGGADRDGGKIIVSGLSLISNGSNNVA